MSETKKCPYCGETIMADASKCRYCKEWLSETGNKKSASISKTQESSIDKPGKKEGKPQKPKKSFGTIIGEVAGVAWSLCLLLYVIFRLSKCS